MMGAHSTTQTHGLNPPECQPSLANRSNVFKLLHSLKCSSSWLNFSHADWANSCSAIACLHSAVPTRLPIGEEKQHWKERGSIHHYHPRNLKRNYFVPIFFLLFNCTAFSAHFILIDVHGYH